MDLHAYTRRIFSRGMINGIHHIAIICSDYEKSKDFYVRILGYTIHAEHFRADRNSYKLDLVHPSAVQLELFSFPDPPVRPSYPESCGLRHLAFSTPDLDATIGHLASFGVSCEPIRVDAFTGQRFTFFADPDQLPIELYEVLG